MTITVAEAYELPAGQYIQLTLPQGGFASIQGIFCLCHGDIGMVVGHCKVPMLFQGEQKILEKIVVRFRDMGNLRIVLSAEEISQCFTPITVNETSN